jgi:hypothetical protein
MAKAGFRQFFYGIESVHQASLDKMGKHTNVDMIKTAVKMATDNGISIFGGMIIGFPGETVQMVRENINFAISLGMDFVQFTPITAFPGTPFFEEMKANGKIATYNWKYYNLFHPMLHTDQLSQLEMYRLVGEAYSKYYLSEDFLKMMVLRMFKPGFGWFFKIAPRWIRQFVIGGASMLKSMGFSFELVKRDPNYHRLQRGFTPDSTSLKERYSKYQIVKFYLIRLKEMKRKKQETLKKLARKALKVSPTVIQ